MNEDNNQLQPNDPHKPETNTRLPELDKSETEQMAPLAPPVVVHHKRSKKPLLALLGLLLIALIAGLAYWYGANNSAEQAKKSATVTVEKDVTIKTQPSETEALLAKISASTGGGDVKPYGYATYYQVESYDFSATAGLEVTWRLAYAVEIDQAKITADNIEAALLKEGFTLSQQQVDSTMNDFNLTKYVSSSVVCGVSYAESEVSSENGNFKGAADIICAPKTAYKVSSEVQKPFYVAYRTEDIHGGEGDLGLPKISESKTPGYKFAEASILFEGSAGGAAGLFYMKPDKSWHFFRSAQQLVLCSDYNTADLKKAFLGERCYIGPTSEESIVKL